MENKRKATDTRSLLSKNHANRLYFFCPNANGQFKNHANYLV